MASTSGAAADDRTTDSSLAGRIFGLRVHNLVKDGGSFMASLCSLNVKAALKSLRRVVGENREAGSVSTVTPLAEPTRPRRTRPVL